MEKEASFLFNNGLSTEAAMDRLVSLGKISIENWECQKAPIDYRCSVDKVLCRNLLLTSLVSAASLAVGSVTIENQPSMFLLGLTTLYVIFLLSMHYVQWRMCNWSLMERKRKALKALDYVAKIATTSFSYAPLGEPLSDEMFTQTALRDGEVVAMPKLLLVEGDIILLRPSQSAPCDCQLLNGEVLRKGDRILNKVIIDHATGGAVPLCATKAIALSTPLIEHFNSIGESQRLHSPLEYQNFKMELGVPVYLVAWIIP
uniref:Calcium-transporting ATPase 13, plasma membrane-type n=1 Tax=Angiostrongylus cantonensis TaxID=6313 RepID=A0A0K0CWK3_ANGCA